MQMRPKVILFGDSITELSYADGGWGASLTDLFARRIDFILRGYSGYNTRGAIHALDRIISSEGSNAPIAVTVFFGANDASLPDRSCGIQHVPIVEYKQNLSSIVSSIKRNNPPEFRWTCKEVGSFCQLTPNVPVARSAIEVSHSLSDD